MIWLVLTIIFCYFLYVTFIKPTSYWKDRNVQHKKPWPLIGNMYPLLARKQAFFYMMLDFYNEFPNERYNGIFQFQKPVLFIRDLDLIKQVTIKDFNFFVNRTSQLTGDTDPILSKALTTLEDDKWRKMRATLSPSFTGSKMKFLFNLVSDCAIQFTKHFESLDSEIIEVEMKDTSSRFANDVIATSAFGITTDSLNEKDNEFFEKGKKATNFGGVRALLLLLYFLCPPLKKVLRISVFSPEIVKFFQRIINETIESREEHGTVRPDMIHLLLESRKEGSLIDHGTTPLSAAEECEDSQDDAVQKAQITDDDIAAQGILFFFAGFDTVSTLASFMSYELALNKDVQAKLQTEIDEVIEKSEGKLTYDHIMGMKYLDMVVSESLRKWPPAIAVDRACGQDYVIEGRTENEKSFLLEKGISIMIPTIAIHRNPDYFPNPDQFDPERFSPENKHKIVPFSYMPFGMGPRNCIASRFALMETKILFFHLLSKFDIVSTDKTPIPLIISKTKINLAPDEGFCLGFQKRN